MLVVRGHWLGPPWPSGWYLAPLLFLAWVKLVTRARRLVDKSGEGCGPRASGRWGKVPPRPQPGLPLGTGKVRHSSSLTPHSSEGGRPSPAPLAVVPRSPSAHGRVKKQRKLCSYNICQDQLAGPWRGKLHFAEKGSGGFRGRHWPLGPGRVALASGERGCALPFVELEQSGLGVRGRPRGAEHSVGGKVNRDH